MCKLHTLPAGDVCCLFPSYASSELASAKPGTTIPRLVVVAAKPRSSRSRLTVCWVWVNVYPFHPTGHVEGGSSRKGQQQDAVRINTVDD